MDQKFGEMYHLLLYGNRLQKNEYSSQLSITIWTVWLSFKSPRLGSRVQRCQPQNHGSDNRSRRCNIYHFTTREIEETGGKLSVLCAATVLRPKRLLSTQGKSKVHCDPRWREDSTSPTAIAAQKAPALVGSITEVKLCWLRLVLGFWWLRKNHHALLAIGKK